MFISVAGIYRDGRVELIEQPTDIDEGTKIIVTFVKSSEIDLASQGIDRVQAEVLRADLATFEDWDSSEMSLYNNYEAALNHTLGR